MFLELLERKIGELLSIIGSSLMRMWVYVSGAHSIYYQTTGQGNEIWVAESLFY